MSNPAKSVEAESHLANSGRVVRSRQDIVMGYMLMALPITCVLAGIAQFVPAWQQSAYAEPFPTTVQHNFARCERPSLGILER